MITPENQQQLENVIKRIYQNLLLQERYPYGVKYKGVGNKVATGKLYNSIYIDNLQFTDDFVEVVYDIETTNNVRYFGVIDKGRRKGATPPPIEPILAWINKRGIGIRDKKGQFIKGSVQNSAKRKLSLAYAISNGISKNRIRPTNIVKLADKEIKLSPQFYALYEQQALETLTKNIDKTKLD
jgi:hypothetical protein